MQLFKDGLQIFLWLANIIIICYGGYKFLNRPHDSLEQRVKALELKVSELSAQIKEHDESLKLGNDRFRKQKRTNAAFKTIMLAFVDFEIAFCQSTEYSNTADLLKAKEKLQKYLTEEDEDD